MKVALVYDRVNKVGGAEKILQCLHHIWPDAPLYTSVYDREGAPWADAIKIIPSFLQRIPGAKRHHEWLFWAMPIAFETFNFRRFDVVISVSSAEAKGIITLPSTLHLEYNLTPIKYLYTQKNLHLNANPLGFLGKPILKLLWHHQARWDQIAAWRPDKLVAISQTVASRCQTYYHRKPDEIIYPPVNTKQFSQKSPNPHPKPYFLLVSRLVPSKKVELAVKAFNRLGHKLVVIGVGVDLKRLKKLAKPNVTFLGQVGPQELSAYYQHCLAFVYPSEEDFGIVIAEALAAGKPVIAFKKGGAGEIIDHGVHGLLFDRQGVSSIMKSVSNFRPNRFRPAVLRKRAARYSRKIFESRFEQFVRRSWQNHLYQL